MELKKLESNLKRQIDLRHPTETLSNLSTTVQSVSSAVQSTELSSSPQTSSSSPSNPHTSSSFTSQPTSGQSQKAQVRIAPSVVESQAATSIRSDPPTVKQGQYQGRNVSHPSLKVELGEFIDSKKSGLAAFGYKEGINAGLRTETLEGGADLLIESFLDRKVATSMSAFVQEEGNNSKKK